LVMYRMLEYKTYPKERFNGLDLNKKRIQNGLFRVKTVVVGG